ncbi:MAG: ankyrin repeat domain-containing protein, partial [Xanthobacteraceae bacterium]
MIRLPLAIIICASLLALLAVTSPARAQAPQPHREENCGEIESNYELVKADAVSVQTNMALFAAADRGCEALAHKLLDAGASLLARDRRGAMPLAHAARAGQPKLVELFLAKGAPIDAL